LSTDTCLVVVPGSHDFACLVVLCNLLRIYLYCCRKWIHFVCRYPKFNLTRLQITATLKIIYTNELRVFYPGPCTASTFDTNYMKYRYKVVNRTDGHTGGLNNVCTDISCSRRSVVLLYFLVMLSCNNTIHTLITYTSLLLDMSVKDLSMSYYIMPSNLTFHF
jgi:hypothetical protein